jgi:hypothetical protein
VKRKAERERRKSLSFAPGFFLMMAAGDYLAGSMFDPLRAAGVAGSVGLVWTLPNALVLFFQRGKFIDVDTKKPGV